MGWRLGLAIVSADYLGVGCRPLPIEKPFDEGSTAQAPPRAVAATPGTKKAKPFPVVRWVAILGVLGMFGCLGSVLTLRVAGTEAFEIEGPSMEPSFPNGTRIMINKSAYGLFLPFTHEAIMSWGSPAIGDVVVLHSQQDNIDVFKRIVGVAGDTIEFRRNDLYRNGSFVFATGVGIPATGEGGGGMVCLEERLGDVRYFTVSEIGWLGHRFPPQQIPDGHVYVLGDHRDRSNDSRFFGPVPISRLKGRYSMTYQSGEIRVHCP